MSASSLTEIFSPLPTLKISRTQRALEGGDIGGDHVAHMDKIAPLAAVAVNFQHRIVGMAAQENSQHQSIGAGFGLARAINIEVAQHQAGQVEVLVEQQAILLADPLGQAIHVEQVGRVAFAVRRGRLP